MGIIAWANSRVKRLDWADISLIKVSVLFFALLLAKLYSPILSLDWQWYALVFVLAAIKPAYDLFKKK